MSLFLLLFLVDRPQCTQKMLPFLYSSNLCSSVALRRVSEMQLRAGKVWILRESHRVVLFLISIEHRRRLRRRSGQLRVAWSAAEICRHLAQLFWNWALSIFLSPFIAQFVLWKDFHLRPRSLLLPVDIFLHILLLLIKWQLQASGVDSS